MIAPGGTRDRGAGHAKIAIDRGAWTALENWWGQLAAAEGSVVLPSPAPAVQVNYLLVGSEPTAGGTDAAVIATAVAAGARSLHPMLLHLAVRRWLLGPGERYAVTHVGKGAVLVPETERVARRRRRAWLPALEAEADLVLRPGGVVIPIGLTLDADLRALGARVAPALLHYAHGPVVAHRRAGVAAFGLEERVEQLGRELVPGDLVATAEAVAAWAGLPAPVAEQVVAHERLLRSRVSFERWQADLQLLALYERAFTALRRRRRAAAA